MKKTKSPFFSYSEGWQIMFYSFIPTLHGLNTVIQSSFDFTLSVETNFPNECWAKIYWLSLSVFDVESSQFNLNKNTRINLCVRSRVLVMCAEAVWVITWGLRIGLLRAQLFVLAWTWRIPGALRGYKEWGTCFFIIQTSPLSYSDQSVAWDYQAVCNNWIRPVSTVTDLGKSRELGPL